MNLNRDHTKLFLDNVDTILNSNTFLLETTANFKSLEQATVEISDFISSGNFKAQILEQDLIRGWGNYHRINHKGQYVSTAMGNFVKPSFKIELTEMTQQEAVKYLRSMLTVEPNSYNFWSPYNKQLDKSKADVLVQNFLSELMLTQDWKLYTLNTDFCYSKVDRYHKKKATAYFEGDYGSDSATLMVREDNKAFFLLTNGID